MIKVEITCYKGSIFITKLGPGGPAIVSSMIEFDEGQCDITTFERVNNGFMHTDAIVNDIADVATLAFSNFELIEAKHRGLDVDFFALKDYGIPDFNQLILMTSEECFEQKKEDIKLLVKILHRAVLYIKTNPIEAKQIYFKYSDTISDDFTNECYDTTAKCFTSDFSMELSYYESLNQWMYSKKITGKSVDVNNENLWSNELVSDLLVK
jgi:putative hydroxymethylpyrimidine transport system substrate-binding protein